MKLGDRFRRRLVLLGLFVTPCAGACIWLAGLLQVAPAYAQTTGEVQDRALAGTNQKVSDLVVHEWGTFLGMSGVGRDGPRRHVSRRACPAGVRARSQPRPAPAAPDVLEGRDAGHLLLHQGDSRTCGSACGFPRGIWTQWYPQAAAGAPEPAEPGRAVRRADGRADLLVRRSDPAFGDAAFTSANDEGPCPSS